MIRHDQRAVGAIALATFVGLAGLGSVNIAALLIAEDFHTTLGIVSWVISSYMLVLAGFCIITGRIADHRGLKRTFLEGTLLFTVSSLVCFCTPDVLVLILARVFQAAGAAMFIATGQALIAVVLPLEKRGAGLSWFNAAALVGTVVGIGMGGIVSDAIGWRYIFLLLALPALAAFFLARKYVPEVPARPVKAPFDIAGSVLFFSAMTALLTGLSMDYQPAVTDLTPAILYLVSFILWAAFILHTRRTPDPVLDLALFRDRQFSFAIISRTIMDITFGGLTFMLPLVLTTGLIMMVAAGLSFLISPLAGRLADRYGSRPVCIGCVILTLGILAGFNMLSRQYIPLIALLTVFFRMSVAAYASPSGKLVLDHCPADRAGAASGLMQTSRYAAYSVGIAIFIFAFETAVYGAGMPNDGTPIIPRLTIELLRPGYLAIFQTSVLVTLPAIFFSYLAHDQKRGDRPKDDVKADGDAGRASGL
ncbi:MAG: MFS transporter [Methanomicrobiales archaeon]|nr:MFS transporter [Methanomicrobiales archaeon]